MCKSIAVIFLACYFLAGSVILPLSDFSLMKDLPGMYNAYCKVKSGTPDVIDFVGDYLLGGKDLFGHNTHDAPVKADGSIQFQHQANTSLFFTQHFYRLPFLQVKPVVIYPVHRFLFYTSDYQSELFRPPLG